MTVGQTTYLANWNKKQYHTEATHDSMLAAIWNAASMPSRLPMHGEGSCRHNKQAIQRFAMG